MLKKDVSLCRIGLVIQTGRILSFLINALSKESLIIISNLSGASPMRSIGIIL